MRARLTWAVRARPVDFMIGVSTASASLPVIGKRLEPLGPATAMGVWGYRHLPDFLAETARQWLSPGATDRRKSERAVSASVSVAGLQDLVSADLLEVTWPEPRRIPPIWSAGTLRRRYLSVDDVPYGPHRQQRLEIWRRRDLKGPAPVFIFVPGGGWIHGSRLLQGTALLAHMAELGWVCISMSYRVAPHHRWPAHIHDVKRAVAWTRAHASEYGGDPGFVSIAGTSAGGHLAALAGLTSANPDLQTEPGADTHVDAVVGMYGRYDWERRDTLERVRFMDFLERVVVARRQSAHPEIFHAASPISQITAAAPPFLVIHGSDDTVIPVAQAREFVERLRAESSSDVAYVEFPGGHHGLDMTDGARTDTAMTVIGLFLNEIHRRGRSARDTMSAESGAL